MAKKAAVPWESWSVPLEDLNTWIDMKIDLQAEVDAMNKESFRVQRELERVRTKNDLRLQAGYDDLMEKAGVPQERMRDVELRGNRFVPAAPKDGEKPEGT